MNEGGGENKSRLWGFGHPARGNLLRNATAIFSSEKDKYRIKASPRALPASTATSSLLLKSSYRNISGCLLSQRACCPDPDRLDHLAG